jgi:hypothetical protein
LDFICKKGKRWSLYSSMYVTSWNRCQVLLSLSCSLTAKSLLGIGRPVVFKVKVKVKQSRNRPGVAQRVPEGLDYKISMTFGT